MKTGGKMMEKVWEIGDNAYLIQPVRGYRAVEVPLCKHMEIDRKQNMTWAV